MDTRKCIKDSESGAGRKPLKDDAHNSRWLGLCRQPVWPSNAVNCTNSEKIAGLYGRERCGEPQKYGDACKSLPVCKSTVRNLYTGHGGVMVGSCVKREICKIAGDHAVSLCQTRNAPNTASNRLRLSSQAQRFVQWTKRDA